MRRGIESLRDSFCYSSSSLHAFFWSPWGASATCIFLIESLFDNLLEFGLVRLDVLHSHFLDGSVRKYDIEVSFTVHAGVVISILPEPPHSYGNRVHVLINLLWLVESLFRSCLQLSKARLVSRVVELEELVLLAVLERNDGCLACLEREKIDAVAVFLVHSRRQRLQSKVQVHLVNLLLIRVEYELLNDFFHNFYLFLRYLFFSTFNGSFHLLQPCIFVIFLRFLRFCVELLTVDMSKVFFELFALLILIG